MTLEDLKEQFRAIAGDPAAIRHLTTTVFQRYRSKNHLSWRELAAKCEAAETPADVRQLCQVGETHDA